MSQEEFANALEELINVRKDADRWKKLMKLIGTPSDCSDSVIRFFWDDATMTPFIKVGLDSPGTRSATYYVERGSFEAVIDSIPEPKC